MNLEGLRNVKFKEPKDVKMTKLSKKVIVKNVTEGEEPYVVARLFENEYWYWGRYPTEERAEEVAEEVGGIVLC